MVEESLSSTGSEGATQFSFGKTPVPGTLGHGGNASTNSESDDGSGGGGGYFGGAAGWIECGSGGGGSGYANSKYFSSISYQTGGHSGDGVIIITQISIFQGSCKKSILQLHMCIVCTLIYCIK